MKQFIFVVTIFLCFAHSYGGARNDTDSPILVADFQTGDHTEFNYRIASRLRDLTAARSGTIVIRLCSTFSVEKALAASAGKPFELYEQLRKFGLEPESVMFYQFKECARGSTVVPGRVEYWFVPVGASLEFDERVSAAEVNFVDFHSARDAIRFEKSLKTFSAYIRNEGFKGFVVAYHFEKLSEEMKGRAKGALNLAECHIQCCSQVEIIELKWYGFIPSGSKEPQFPTLVVVKINDENPPVNPR